MVEQELSPKPYKIVDMETKEVLLKGKLDEDNYVLVSLSKSMKKIGFDFKRKFIFVKRLEGVSGTKIRESIISGDLMKISNMLPNETIEILEERSIKVVHHFTILGMIDGIIERVNNSSYSRLKITGIN